MSAKTRFGRRYVNEWRLLLLHLLGWPEARIEDWVGNWLERFSNAPEKELDLTHETLF